MPRGVKAGGAAAKEAKAEPSVVSKTLKVRKTPATKEQSALTHEKASEIKELEERRRQMKDQLQQVELQIFKLESQYLEKANPRGNALKGYEGLLSSIAANAKKATVKQEDRIFSNSSTTGS